VVQTFKVPKVLPYCQQWVRHSVQP
jgi:hypothetical protein